MRKIHFYFNIFALVAVLSLVSPAQAARDDDDTPGGGPGGDFGSAPEPATSSLALLALGVTLIRRRRS